MYNSVHSSKGFKGSSKNPHTPSPELVNTFNNNLGQSTQCQFIFNNRTIPLKWKDLMKVDIDLMLRKNNINDLEPHLNNLIFGTVEENDLQIASEEHVVKLIKMFQYSLEYLFFYQQKLENQIDTLQSNYNSLVEQGFSKENELKENKNLIALLKKDKKEKETIIITYKALINEFRRKNGIYDAKITKDKSQVQGYYECSYCNGKVFSTEDMLQKHLIRRHVGQTLPKKDTLDKTKNDVMNKSVVEEKITNLQQNFEVYLKTITDPMINYFSSQKNLEKELLEVKKESQLSKLEIENQVKSILLELKDIYSNSNNPNLKDKDNSNIMTFEEIKKLTSELDAFKNQLEEISKNQKLQQKELELQNNKEKQFSENETIRLNRFLEAEKEELKKLREEGKQEFTKVAEEMRSSLREISFRKVEVVEIKKEASSITQSPVIEVAKPMIIEKPIENKVVKEVVKYEKKKIFNSGPLESDDDKDEENPIIIPVQVPKQEKTEKIEKVEKVEKSINAKLFKTVVSPILKKEEEAIKPIEPEIQVKQEEPVKDKIIEEVKPPVVPEKVQEIQVIEEDPSKKKENYKPPKSEKKEESVDAKKVNYEKLAQSFNHYMARDMNYEETMKPDFYKSIVHNLGDVKPKSGKMTIDDKLNELLNKESKRISSKGFSEIGKDSNLPKLISVIIDEMESVKQNDQYFEHYYDTANSMFGVKDIARKASNSKSKENVTQVIEDNKKLNQKLVKLAEENNIGKFLTKLHLKKLKYTQ